MTVKYPDGKIHEIDIKSVEEFERDGTFLVRGYENGRSVVLHMTRTVDGKFAKIPHSSLEYVLLMSPMVRKMNVTGTVKVQLDTMGLIGSMDSKESAFAYIKPELKPTPRKEYKYAVATKAKVLVYINERGTKFVTYSTAYNLGLERGMTRDKFHDALSSEPNLLDVPGHVLTDEEFNFIEKNFEIEYVRMVTEKRGPLRDEKHEYKSTNQQKEKRELSYNERGVQESLKGLRELLKTNNINHGGLQNIILYILGRNKNIMKLEPGLSRDCLMYSLWVDIEDMKSFLTGDYKPDQILKNYRTKINAIHQYLIYAKIDCNLTITMLMDVLEMLRDKYNRTGTITFDDMYEPEIILDGIVRIITDTKKEELQGKLDEYMTNNAHYNRIKNSLSGRTR